jgi:uncharacterized damage-inducible protein DinB
MVEVWLRGTLEGFDPLLVPVAHSFLQAREDIAALADRVGDELAWQRPGGAASIGFHILHAGGSVDRLLTYARGEALTAAQLRALKGEDSAAERGTTLRQAADAAHAALDAALNQLRNTRGDDLLTARAVGRARLPSTTIGLLVHAAEHTTRHVGQAITTARILGAWAARGE